MESTFRLLDQIVWWGDLALIAVLYILPSTTPSKLPFNESNNWLKNKQIFAVSLAFDLIKFLTVHRNLKDQIVIINRNQKQTNYLYINNTIINTYMLQTAL